ncbi:MAG: ABC transporter substrate-binding protein [Gammaproteobacteria bacterium]|nr:ABC transporter substrate-binding protein [Gammaproteobacteria bacterium]MYG67475.1 ABC transporter substrate-binding protein [Gammaproteobacteria bacterium]
MLERDKKLAEKLATESLAKGTSRRDTLKVLMASGLGVAGSNLILGTAMQAHAATPNRGGHIRVGVRKGSVSDTMDPTTFLNVFIRVTAYGMCNGLFEIKSDDSLGGELIESWEPRPGAAEWVFKVRKGVEFHNGKSLVADDIIASINHHRGENSKSGMKGPLGSVAEIIKNDNHTITFKLTGGNADFPYVFTDYRMSVMPANEDGSLNWQAHVGTGGYLLKNFEPGISAELERAPNYWRAGHANFDSARILVVPDLATRQTSLINGELDAIDQIDFKTLSLLKRQSSIKLVDTTGAKHYTYVMNTQIEPYNNNDLRLALKYGIDRKAMLHTLLRGYGSIGNDHPVAPSHQFFAGDLEQRSYDPDKARFHLKKAGYDKISMDMSTSDSLYPGAVDGAVLYKEQLAPTGIDINVVREPGDGYYSNVWKKKPFLASFWGARPTADLILSTAYLSGAPWNDSFIDNARLTSLINEARSEIDSSKRNGMYREIQTLLRDEGGTVIPVFANNVFAISEKIGTKEKIAGNWELDGGRILDRWWFM